MSVLIFELVFKFVIGLASVSTRARQATQDFGSILSTWGFIGLPSRRYAEGSGAQAMVMVYGDCDDDGVGDGGGGDGDGGDDDDAAADDDDDDDDDDDLREFARKWT